MGQALSADAYKMDGKATGSWQHEEVAEKLIAIWRSLDRPHRNWWCVREEKKQKGILLFS